MIIGVDLDNTIICYDALFHRVACERRLVPPEIPPFKDAVRNYLREADKEDLWTEMQGYVYGERILEAAPFPGVIDFFSTCARKGIALTIVSHKTLHPYAGPKYDLHQASLQWLQHYGFLEGDSICLEQDRIYLELTKSAKLARIAEIGCTHFIDDLPEFLFEHGFPEGVVRILFDANGSHLPRAGCSRYTSWTGIKSALLETPEPSA